MIENLKLDRKFGVEFEGYVETKPRNNGNGSITLEFENGELHYDASLRNSDWYENTPYYGIEVVTKPSTDFEGTEKLWSELKAHGWFTDDRASTHIHIEVDDYTREDDAKMLMFASIIQPLMFMAVDNSRYENRYCRLLIYTWETIFESGIKFNNRLSIDRQLSSAGLWGEGMDNSKYSWVNVFGGKYPTIEFRLFEGADSIERVQQFVRIAHNMIDLVKNSTVEQLQFIANECYAQENTVKAFVKLMEALGFEAGEMEIRGTTAERNAETKLHNYVLPISRFSYSQLVFGA